MSDLPVLNPPTVARAATFTVYELPFTSRPQYVSTRLAGNSYRMKLAWNVPANCWVVDIYDVNDAPLLRGMAIVTGADLLAQFEYLGIGGQLLTITDQTSGTDLAPSFDNLGVTGHVFFLPDDAQPL